jgi:hypothetical protein
MAADKKPYRQLAEIAWEGTHFTREECRRAIVAVLEEDRRAAEARRLRRAPDRATGVPRSAV